MCPPGRDRLFGLAPGLFPLFRCKSCGCIFQHPFPDDVALVKFYPQEYWWSENSSTGGRGGRLFRKLEKAYREFVSRDHARFLDRCALSQPGSDKLLLDIGCGNGTFLHVACSHGFKPHGMDVSARAAEIAEAQYGIPVRQGAIGSRAWDDCQFDFVTMFHVLEHTTNPRFALQYARERLRPTGALILQVPNVSSLQARIFGRFWYGLDVPRHTINFTPKALARLLEEMGFEFQISTRFSLRDNPASLASSLAPWLDPVRRKGRGTRSGSIMNGILELAYFGLFLLALPVAFLESLLGVGGTIWVCGWDRRSSSGNRL
jgi:2-polyprenyl-3-methyl-5-hydroxy-6-metoxy-1,4-benzoquinol methylase